MEKEDLGALLFEDLKLKWVEPTEWVGIQHLAKKEYESSVRLEVHKEKNLLQFWLFYNLREQHDRDLEDPALDNFYDPLLEAVGVQNTYFTWPFHIGFDFDWETKSREELRQELTQAVKLVDSVAKHYDEMIDNIKNPDEHKYKSILNQMRSEILN